MPTDWSALTRELARWRGEGRALPVWWRDDDAQATSAPLDRLVTLSERLGLPVHLAVIPKGAEPSLQDICALPQVVGLVHGWAHDNHAPAGAKKAEFGQARKGLAEEARQGLASLQRLIGPTLVPMFVPPWNRITGALVPDLPGLGYDALSTFTPRQVRQPVPGLVQINTHIDPINWRGGGGLVAQETVLDQLVILLRDRREGRADTAEPLGVLTHHLVHDEAIWSFSEQLIGRLLDAGAMPLNLMELRENLP